MKTKRKLTVLILILVMIIESVFAYRFNYIPHRKYEDSDFGIMRYTSMVDADGDGIDDQTDILNGVRGYLDTKPKYKSRYYNTGYPDDHYGVCTDVVAYGLLDAGYDLQNLIDVDIQKNPENYTIDSPDRNIDFRRVGNINAYLSNHAIVLTNDINAFEEWQAGDIVVWAHHIGIISDHRNAKGIPFVLHHASPYQASYEEDILSVWGEITGHYRMS